MAGEGWGGCGLQPPLLPELIPAYTAGLGLSVLTVTVLPLLVSPPPLPRVGCLLQLFPVLHVLLESMVESASTGARLLQWWLVTMALLQVGAVSGRGCNYTPPKHTHPNTARAAFPVGG